jgi:hypothetical protein
MICMDAKAVRCSAVWAVRAASESQRRAHIGRGNLYVSVSNWRIATDRRGRRTLGGIRVERPRFCMKLILTAAGQLASIDLSADSRWAGRRTWAGKVMSGDVEVGHAAAALEVASFCRCRQASSIIDPHLVQHLHAALHYTTLHCTALHCTACPPCPPFPGQLARGCLHMPFAHHHLPPGPPFPTSARMPPRSRIRTSTQPAPRMRPPSSLPANRHRPARKARRRECGTSQTTTSPSTTGPATSPPSPSASWTAASLARAWQLPCSLAPRWIFRRAQFGALHTCLRSSTPY